MAKQTFLLSSNQENCNLENATEGHFEKKVHNTKKKETYWALQTPLCDIREIVQKK